MDLSSQSLFPVKFKRAERATRSIMGLVSLLEVLFVAYADLVLVMLLALPVTREFEHCLSSLGFSWG